MPLDLTDEVLPFTPVDVDKPFVMAPGAAMPSPFAGPFPPAHEGSGLINTAGEYRGVYPTTSGYAWLPDWSTYRSIRASPTKPHWGIDLYAPVGTPLVAVVDGSVDFLTDAGNKLGLYARLRFVVAGKEYALHYGHMSRAEGGPRTILKGAILGYVGCSGNADQHQSCSVNVPGKPFSASHVHVALLPPAPAQTSLRSNPISVFGWVVNTPKKPTGVPWTN